MDTHQYTFFFLWHLRFGTRWCLENFKTLYSGVLFLVESQAAVEEEEEDTFSLSTHFLPDNALWGIFLPIY